MDADGTANGAGSGSCSRGGQSGFAAQPTTSSTSKINNHHSTIINPSLAMRAVLKKTAGTVPHLAISLCVFASLRETQEPPAPARMLRLGPSERAAQLFFQKHCSLH